MPNTAAPGASSGMQQTSLSLLSLNCKGLNDPKKRSGIANLFKNYDIACLQETHSTQRTIKSWKEFRFRDVSVAHGAHNSKGSLIASKRSFNATSSACWDGRITKTTISAFQQDLNILSVYAPNTNGSRATKAEYRSFLQELDTIISGCVGGVILCGDLNLIMERLLDAENPNASSYFPDLVDEWRNLLSRHDLVDYPLRSFISSLTRLVTRNFRCQLTLLTLITFGVAWSRDWTMTSKLRVVEFGVRSLEMLYSGRFNGVDPCQQALTDDFHYKS
jgi:exonuclease III